MKGITSLVQFVHALRDPSLPKWVKFLPVLGLIYWISPVDIVPDPLLVLGWIDDVVVVLTVASQFFRLVRNHNATRALPPTSTPAR